MYKDTWRLTVLKKPKHINWKNDTQTHTHTPAHTHRHLTEAHQSDPDNKAASCDGSLQMKHPIKIKQTQKYTYYYYCGHVRVCVCIYFGCPVNQREEKPQPFLTQQVKSGKLLQELHDVSKGRQSGTSVFSPVSKKTTIYERMCSPTLLLACRWFHLLVYEMFALVTLFSAGDSHTSNLFSHLLMSLWKPSCMLFKKGEEGVGGEKVGKRKSRIEKISEKKKLQESKMKWTMEEQKVKKE